MTLGGAASPRGGKPQGTAGVVRVADPPELMGLSGALEGLREELESAWKKGAGKEIRFRVSEVTLTLQAVARRDVEGSGKIR
jgi:Trypsin-co-occurring domain 2